MKLSKRVDGLLGSMSLEEKAGQVFVFTIVNLRQALNDLRLKPGGYVRIYSDAITVAKQNAKLQAESEIPLILSADFERGIGSTVTGAIDMVTNMCLGATGDESLAFETGKAIAEEGLAIGINMNYVPVLDVNVNEANPIINTRAFGGDPELVARMGAAFIRGHREGGVLTCGKHFPGHGDTHVDTHTQFGALDASRARIEAVELVPFRAAIAAGVDSIMSAHLSIPAYEPAPIPATLSPCIMRSLLRDELGFEGVAVSDALEMGAIAKSYTPHEAIIRAFKAGCDQLIMPVENERAVLLLTEAVKDKHISESRLDEAVARILTMKENRGLLDAPPANLSNLASSLETPAHYQSALNAALAGISLIRDSKNILPLKPDAKVAVITFSNSDDSRSYFLEPKTFGSHCERFVREMRSINCGLLDERAVHEFGVIERSLAAASQADVILLGAYVKVVINRGTVELEQRYVNFVESLLALGKKTVLVSFGSPYLIKQFPAISAFICAYGATEATQEAASLLVCGKAQFRGTLPVTLTIPVSLQS